MQRSDLILLGGGLGLAALTYVVAGELVAGVVGGAILLGVAVGSLLPAAGQGRTGKATVRKVRTTRATASSRATAVTAVSATARGPSARLALEPARASAAPATLPELRLTGDILHGMQTGGKTTRGLCSACGATLWLSARRPLKATCPVCGHTRVLEK